MNYLDESFDLEDPELVSMIDELPLWSAPFGLTLLDAIRYRKNITALDIGFGTGFPLLEIAMRLGAGSKVIGIDPWIGALERTRNKIHRYGIENVQLIEGHAESIPLADNSIDLIVSNNGINNVDDLDRVLSECARVSKRGAQFLATMNLDTTMMEFYTVMEDVLRERGQVEWIETMKKHIRAKRRPLDELVADLQKNAFTLPVVTHDAFRYTFASGTTMLNHSFIRMAFLGPWKSIIAPEEQKSVFEQIESRMNAKAEVDGCIHLSVPFVMIESEKA
ncbi:MAG: methyltransferase domain-containing protein [Ignavibacteriales bacterium]|nr:methyltransferase domain-containing protein [Ignavibacteriales bacterium]